MAKKKKWHQNQDGQIMVRIDIENGVPRVRMLTAQEEREFYRTHPNVSLPTYSVDYINQITSTDPPTKSPPCDRC
jgi:hypothetical protein